ncbi:hypothetical protein QYF36_027002 [Acer negundo]|nr:hypothetical protein QYF36_027002 [Acer negundo]
MRGTMGWYVVYTIAFDIRIYLMLKSRAKPIQYVDGTVIVQQRDLIDEMIIFLCGQPQLTLSSLHGRPNDQEDPQIVVGDLMGWLANGAHMFALPLSIVKVKVVTNIEAIKISAYDLKEIYDAANNNVAATH